MKSVAAAQNLASRLGEQLAITTVQKNEYQVTAIQLRAENILLKEQVAQLQLELDRKRAEVEAIKSRYANEFETQKIELDHKNKELEGLHASLNEALARVSVFVPYPSPLKSSGVEKGPKDNFNPEIMSPDLFDSP